MYNELKPRRYVVEVHIRMKISLNVYIIPRNKSATQMINSLNRYKKKNIKKLFNNFSLERKWQ